MQNKNLFLEEAVLDDIAEEFDYMELPLQERAFKLVGGLALLAALIVLGKVVSLNMVQGAFYTNRSLMNASAITTSRAERGIIFDRNNKPLVSNIPAFRVTVNLAELLKNEKNRAATISTLEPLLALEPGYIANLLSSVNLEKQNSLTISREVNLDEVLKIKNLHLASVEVQNDFEREYVDSEVFAHILGYTGFVDRNDLKKNPSLSLNDSVGKTGIEAEYDTALRGEDGEALKYRDVSGTVIGNKTLKNGTPGDELYLTIDADFQKYFYDRLKQGLDAVGSKSGVGIAIDPQTGALLALLTIPSFDNNGIQSKDLVDPMKPLFNRAIAGAYAPGSTIKPLVAYAALKENVIAPDKQIYSPGYLDVPNPYNPDLPTRFLDWRPQGWVDIYSALARSSNVYFYEVGGGFEGQQGLGITRLKEYWAKFGLGKETGIDLPGENSGFLPDPETKEKADRGIWRIGDTYNVTIGQGDLLVTPLQLINYIATIANGGKVYAPFILDKIVDASGATTRQTAPHAQSDYSSDADIFHIIQQGMIDGVVKDYGTSHTLADLPIDVAAKTGTAQINLNTKQNAFFVGYAPRENPQVAILVLIENAREGSLNAVPVAKDVFRWYSENRMK